MRKRKGEHYCIEVRPADSDANLRACVAAANKAVLAQQSRLDERNAAAAAAGARQLVAEEDSDSDGGTHSFSAPQSRKTPSRLPFASRLWGLQGI